MGATPAVAWAPDREPLGQRALSQVRATVLDVRARYFSESSDVAGDEHTERAVQVQVLRLLGAAPVTDQTEQNRARALVIRQKLLGSAAADPGQPDSMAAELARWCAEFMPGSSAPPLQLWRFESTGRGLACAETLETGTVALSIPEELLLTASKALSDPRVVPALAASGVELHDDVALALALLLQPVLQPGGAWAAYMRLLPKRPPSALLWTDEQLARLSATQLPAQVRAARRALREVWAALRPVLCAPGAGLFGSGSGGCGSFGLERLMWAYAIVESRGMVIHRSDSDEGTVATETALVPVADMLNHRTTAQLASPVLEAVSSSPPPLAEGGGVPPAAFASFESGGGGGGSSGGASGGGGSGRVLVFRTLCDVEAGEQLYLYYGRLACLQTVQFYGFVEEGMLRHETVQLDIEPPDEEEVEDDDDDDDAGDGGGGGGAEEEEAMMVADASVVAVAASGEPKKEEVAVRAARRAALLRAWRVGERHFLRRSGPSPRLLAALRLCLLTPKELMVLPVPEVATGDAMDDDDDGDDGDGRDDEAARGVFDPRRGALSVRHEERVAGALVGVLQGLVPSDELAETEEAEAAEDAAETAVALTAARRDAAASAAAAAAAAASGEAGGGRSGRSNGDADAEEGEEGEEAADPDEQTALDAAIGQMVDFQARLVDEHLEAAALLPRRAEAERAHAQARGRARTPLEG